MPSEGKDFTIEFDSKLLGHQIIFDPNKNNLLIKEIPEALKTQAKQNWRFTRIT